MPCSGALKHAATQAAWTVDASSITRHEMSNHISL